MPLTYHPQHTKTIQIIQAIAISVCVCVSMCTYVPVCVIGRENHYTVSGGGDQHDSLIASLHIYIIIKEEAKEI